MSTPADANVTLQKDEGISKPVNPVVYQSIIGSLLHAAVGTRPNIYYAVAVALKFSSEPAEAHVCAVKQIYRYLKGSLDVSLKYNSLDMHS